MNQFLLIQTSAQLAGRSGLSPLESQTLQQHSPDAHWVLLQDDVISAYCSLWWRHTPLYDGHISGFIGHYAAQDPETARQLLTHASEKLAAEGCTIAIAPIDGNTWRRYRLVSDRGTEPTFFLEPDQPDQWCDHFYSAGFEAIAQYSSAVATHLTQQDPRLARVAERLERLKVQVRSLRLEQFPQELEAIYTLSITSFRRNLLYTPIDRAEFMAQYSQIQPYLQPDLVLMAEQEGNLIGFLFAVPDLLQARRGAIDTIILKTVAVLPGKAYAGLGNLLVAKCQAIAHNLGYTRVIHALMHDDNNSRNLSRRYADPIRRYTLFGRPL